MLVQEQTAPQDRRKHPRFIVHEQITIQRAFSTSSIPGTLQDLSRKGCLVSLESTAHLRVADVVDLQLRADAGDLHVMGAVRHTSPDGLIAGLAFLRDDASQSHEVAAFLSALQGRSHPNSAAQLAD